MKNTLDKFNRRLNKNLNNIINITKEFNDIEKENNDLFEINYLENSIIDSFKVIKSKIDKILIKYDKNCIPLSILSDDVKIIEKYNSQYSIITVKQLKDELLNCNNLEKDYYLATVIGFHNDILDYDIGIRIKNDLKGA